MASSAKQLLVILGPTAVGKTEYCLREAERLGCPIISADSRQIFRDIPIGTAQPTAAELARVPHYNIGTLPLDAYYSASMFEQDVLNICSKEFERHDTLIMTGGSMMYIDAVCNGIDDIPTVTEDVREWMRQRYESEGLDTLLQELRLLDPEHYDEVDKRNPKRVVHALEICHQTGLPYSSFRKKERKQRPFLIRKIGLTRQREELYDRINRRVLQMMDEGLLEEARRVYPQRHLNSLNTVGYKELFAYMDHEIPLDEAIRQIQSNTRRYARKQLTWFKRDSEIEWHNLSDYER